MESSSTFRRRMPAWPFLRARERKPLDAERMNVVITRLELMPILIGIRRRRGVLHMPRPWGRRLQLLQSKVQQIGSHADDDHHANPNPPRLGFPPPGLIESRGTFWMQKNVLIVGGCGPLGPRRPHGHSSNCGVSLDHNAATRTMSHFNHSMSCTLTQSIGECWELQAQSLGEACG
jgi:hypothetical protein